MALTVTSAKLTGNPNSTNWVQVHDFTPADKEKLIRRGRLVALFCVERENPKKGGLDSALFGREILARFHEEYYGNLEKEAFSALSEAVTAVVKEFSQADTKLEIGAIAFLESVLYVASFGVRACLIRNSRLVEILGEAGEVKSASGHPEAGDVFLMGSKAFFAVLPEGRIKSAFSGGEIDKAIQKLTPAIHATEVSAAKAGAFALGFQERGRAFVPKIEDLPHEVGEKIPKVSRPRLFLANSLGAIARLLPEKKIKVRQETQDLESEKHKKVAATAGAILVLLLIVSIGFGIRQKEKRDIKNAYAPRLDEARYEFEEAKSLASLNPGRARELVLGARTQAQTLKSEGVNDSGLDSLLAEIEMNLGSLAGIYEPEFETFNLSLINNGFRGDSLSLSEDYMLVLDRGGEKLVSMKIATKKTKVVAGSDVIDKPIEPGAYAENNYLLAEEGIFELDDGASELVVEKDWESDVFFYVYAGNVYLLDKSQSAVWRYPAIEGGFAGRQNWFGPGVKPNLDNVISWTIDGSIWLLSAGGRISKFTLGKQDGFSVKSSDLPLTSATKIYTNEENKYLYVLDAANSRVVVFDKEGEFKGEYLSEKIKEGISLVASEKSGKMILLTGEKLYFTDLKHL